MEDLVALETRRSGDEIANHQRRDPARRVLRLGTGEHHGGSTAVGRVNRWLFFAGSGGPGQETGITFGRMGMGGSPGDDGWGGRWSWGSGPGGRERRIT